MDTSTGGTVIGLDISLTSTGISDGVTADAIQAGPLRGEARMDYILGEIMHQAGSEPRLAVIEGAAFSRLGPGHDELAGLRWTVRNALWREGFLIAIVPPTTLKKWTTGSGTAGKDDMAAAVASRWGVDFSGTKVGRGRYDMVDAYALAKMGEAFYAGEACEAVQWPGMNWVGL